MATNINRVTITGNLTKDAELRQTAGGMPILTLSVAVNERRKVDGEWQDSASFIDCTMFGRRAEGIQPYLPKGTKVAIDGSLRTRAYETKDGQRRKAVEVVVDELEFMSRTGSAPSFSAPQKAPEQPSGFYDEEIPF